MRGVKEMPPGRRARAGATRVAAPGDDDIKGGGGGGSSDDGGDDNDEDEDEDEDEGDDEAGKPRGDGMADMMSKILNQSVTTGSNPVLAKRKTTIMKEMEDAKEDRERLKRLRTQRKAERERQLEVPDASSADYERQLRKLATRGVVALFNAISTAKREEAEAKSAEAAKNADEGKEISRLDVKRMTQANFRELLKGEEAAAASKSTGSRAPGAAVGDAGGKASLAASASSSTAAAKDKSWSALRDDYLLESSMKLKDWDKDSDGSDNDDGEADLALDEAALKT